MTKSKVFCIGWHKTGTTTLGDALLLLGYKVVGARLDLAKPLLSGDVEACLELAEDFEAFQDVPWAALFRELDKRFPGSKFIVTERDEQKWQLSALAHFNDTYIPLHEWLYGNGVMKGNEALYVRRYRQHYSEIKQYFKDRPGDVLYMELGNGDGWDKLCSFLGHRILKRKFPHSNKARHSFNFKDRLVDRLKSITPMPLRQLRISILRWCGVPDPRYRFNNRDQNQQMRKEFRHGSGKTQSR